MLRETIGKGLKMGNWDMKAGDKLFIKTADSMLTLPETIEFSDRPCTDAAFSTSSAEISVTQRPIDAQ